MKDAADRWYEQSFSAVALWSCLKKRPDRNQFFLEPEEGLATIFRCGGRGWLIRHFAELAAGAGDGQLLGPDQMLDELQAFELSFVVDASARGVTDGLDVELPFPVAEDVRLDAKLSADFGDQMVLAPRHFHISWRVLRLNSRAMLSRGEAPSYSIL